MKLTVGFDAKRIVRNGTGLGSYGRTLVNDLIRQGDDDIALRLYVPDKGRDDLRHQILDGATFCYPTANCQLLTAIWRTHGIVKNLQKDGIQVYHGLSGELPIGLKKAGIKGVVTIHDLIFMRHPEYYHWIDTKIYEWKFRQTVKEADRIIAISERTKQDIMELGGVSEDKIMVIYQSYAPRFSEKPSPEQVAAIRERYQLPEHFILNVGTIEQRKNLRLVVDALNDLPEDIHLVAVGRQTKYAAQLPKNPRVHLLSGVNDEALTTIYSLAEVFVYPSRYEGFGIPIIEAIAAGLPVVACTGSCLEEAGGPASMYVDPDDAKGMASAVLSMLKGNTDREQRIRQSQQYIERFKGTDVAGQVLEVYRSLL